MEAHEGQFRSVHVLRHTFRPSEALARRLQEMVEPQKGAAPPRFLLTSTREVAVNELAFQDYRYDLPIQERREEFYKHSGGVAIQSVAQRFTPKGDFLLRFTPRDTAEFAQLTAPIDTLPDIVDQSARSGEYYMDLHLYAARLVGREALASAWHWLREDIRNDTTNRLYGAVPDDITGPQRTVMGTTYLAHTLTSVRQ